MNFSTAARHAAIIAGMGLIISCGDRDSATTPDRPPVPGAVERAQHHSLRGDHLTASRHLEVALAITGEELTILPKLVVEQIRSGRLLAALDTTSRLCALQPGNSEASEIHQLVERLIGVRRPLQPEVTP